jgi:hypothetical protein
MKQGCKDLYVINYRLRELAAKNYKTQEIVLANWEKFRVRSEKFHGGAGLRRCNRSEGFLQIMQDTENYTIITKFFRD